ncbi:MAG: flagellar motor switch protein FliN [Oscillospiraceae bacterium]|nr:flagellar motor switch protein FliN [Oscillospiraceae bacterium]
MEKELFSSMAIDALGEMMNISLGSSATAVSNMLDQRVDITTPKVSVIETKDFSIGNLEPAMGVEIKYVSGLEGSNIMLLKRSDVKVIVDILMGAPMAEEEFELNELTISAVCELMNQMMGAAATALSDFLGYSVNISTPQPFELDDLEAFKEAHLPQGAETLVVVRFALKIEGALESEFMNVMSVDLARALLKGLGLTDDIIGGEAESPAAAPASAPAPAPAAGGGGDGKMSQEEIEKMLASMNGGEPEPPAPAPAPAPAASGGGDKMSQDDIEKLMASMGGGDAAPAPAPAPAAPAEMPAGMPPMGMPMGMPPGAMPAAGGQQPVVYYMPYPYPPQPAAAPQPDPKVINTQPLPLKQMDPAAELGKEQAQNLDLIMEVPLQVTVEIGRTRRKVQDILEFSKGSLVVLDKLAGDQVDLFVNGKCIARGDVVVVDDNFGVRITEIVQNSGIEKMLQK